MRNEELQGPPEPEPPRREFRFKPTEFEQTNRSADAAPGPAPLDVRQLNRLAGPPTSSAPVNAENEVHALLRANVARADTKGENAVIVRRRRSSRRKRDYWLLLAAGYLLVVGIVLGVGINVMTLAFGAVAITVLTIVVTWIMWFVLDDY